MNIDEVITIIECIALFLLYVTFNASDTNKLSNSKFKNVFVYIRVSGGLIFIGYILLGIILYIRFVFRELKDFSSPFSIFFLTALSLFLVITLGYYFIKYIKDYKKKKEITYYREIPQLCSTAMASYLINQKIEKQKDLFSTIINLVSKKVIDIIPTSNGYTYKKLNNHITLKEDEQYVYDWLFTENKKIFSMLTWQNIIKKELKFNNLIETKEKKNKKNIIFFFIWFAIFCTGGILNWTSVINEEMFEAFLSIVLYPFIIVLPGMVIFEKLEIKIDNYILSSKGKEIYLKLKSLKRFLKDFSIISERKSEEVYVWNEYLAFALVLNVNLNYKDIKSLNMPFLDEIQKQELYEDLVHKLASIGNDD